MANPTKLPKLKKPKRPKPPKRAFKPRKATGPLRVLPLKPAGK